MYILVQENKKEKVEQRKEKEDDIYIEKNRIVLAKTSFSHMQEKDILCQVKKTQWIAHSTKAYFFSCIYQTK